MCSARFLVGVGAWLLGASAATGGSLLAVSLLGQGIVAPAPSQQLTVAAVNRALASEAAEAPRAASPPRQSPRGSRRPCHPPRRTQVRRPGRAVRAAAHPAPQATSAVLTSAGGTVVARCQVAGAYLLSWSPRRATRWSASIRGPAASAQAKFASNRASRDDGGDLRRRGAPATTSTHRSPMTVATTNEPDPGPFRPGRAATARARQLGLLPVLSTSRASVGQAAAARLAWSTARGAPPWTPGSGSPTGRARSSPAVVPRTCRARCRRSG